MVAVLGLSVALAPQSHAETRSLKLYYLHTGERADITYKRNGRYLKSGLDKINWHLRDWRRDEPTKMDPQLLDLVWEVYQKSGSKDYIHVISGYRSPATNNMLRRRGRGVARKSQHTLGKALDFFLPDVKLSKLRDIGLRMETGGVGFYPGSGSPFIHLDTGRVRHWPRMNRKQLARVFPNGRTLHVPSDGKPLPGYEQAKARYEARKARSGRIEIASGAEEDEKDEGGGLFARLFARNDAARTPSGGPDEDTRTRLARPEGSPPAAVASAGPESTASTDETVVAEAGTTGPEGGSEEDLPVLASIPVPTMAPRTVVTSGSLLAVAEPPAGADAPIAAELAATGAPLPEQKPLTVAELAASMDATSDDGAIAIAEPQNRLGQLTADEISQLRRSAVPAPARPAPRPAADIGFASAAPEQGTALALAETPGRDAARDAFESALRQPAETDPAPQAGFVAPAPQTAAIPQVRPQARPQQDATPLPAQSTLELALAANRQSSRATEAIRALIEADRMAEAEAASGDAPVTALALSGIPVPQPNPRKQRQPAVAIVTASVAQSLDDIGKWTLSGDRGMQRMARLQPPDFGHNALSLSHATPGRGFVKVIGGYPAGRLSLVGTDPFTTATVLRN